ncbi:MAG: hypothetical protein IJL92_05785 [Thermoguttaceae bacterium]|nr:hypothetical protein [Thermoguttaceae bacterium]
MTRSLDQRRARAAFRRRLGFTMLEIMTSVTLSLMLMYAVARIFSRVGGTMNETTSIMESTNAIRNAKNRLTSDLENITVNPVPPRNSRLNDGYLCYVEGMGASVDRLYSSGGGVDYTKKPALFSTDCVALDAERYQAYGSSGSYEDWVDSTVGDTDDILSFTARAPEGKPFRGRYIRPKYDAYGNIFSGEQDTYESEYAEIVWFVRGTTLYRRVLPILPNERLQDSLYAFDCAWRGGCDASGAPNGSDPDNSIVAAYSNGEFTSDEALELCNFGCGFFRYFDVSVHLDAKGRPEANTLGDLTNRANRYGYWNPIGVGIVNAPSGNNYGSFSIHGINNAWYWLRMPTLQECSQSGFRAGAPFGESQYARSYRNNTITSAWHGLEQTLHIDWDGSDDNPLAAGTYWANQLPVNTAANPVPFINFWDSANIWEEVNYETGDLKGSLSGDYVYNQDVMLTNVLSFNVKAWDPDVNDYIDLGYNLGNNSLDPEEYSNPNDLCSGGYYLGLRGSNNPENGANLTNVPMPCVYDTWSEQYQRDLYLYDQAQQASNASYKPYADPNGTISDIALDGEISSAQLKDYPPPYNVPLKSLQIELRVFDPRSKQIRNQTFVVDLTK